jgi:hypothetical protein
MVRSALDEAVSINNSHVTHSRGYLYRTRQATVLSPSASVAPNMLANTPVELYPFKCVG